MSVQEERDMLHERYALAMERIHEIPDEHLTGEAFACYFARTAEFLMLLEDTGIFLSAGGPETEPLEKLRRRNTALYEDVLPACYGHSYANPEWAVSELGKEFGALLSFLYCEMRGLIPLFYEERLEDIVIRLELFVEAYTAFVYAWQEDGALPAYEDIRGILYWFAGDYTEMAVEGYLREMLVPEGNFAVNIIKTAALEDVRYLFAYGEYVSENEIETARFIAGLPQETIDLIADTYTEGYRIGFQVAGIDLSRKNTVEIRYRLGFERVMRRALENFEKMGLKASCHRAPATVLNLPSVFKSGYYGGEPNRQYDFDHKDDKALFFDKAYMKRRLDVTRTVFEKYRDAARGYAGPAVLETFGERKFEPENKEQAFRMSEEQNDLWVEYRTMAGELQHRYILEEERSYTIIAFPAPEIRECFGRELLKKLGMRDADECYREFFREIIRVNTLDYTLYRDIQQVMIDALDRADFCEIKGMAGNRTNLRVNLHKLEDPEKETIFENCVADVNIPVGEVFTSPVLEGTEGVLHVSRVFLNGLEYKNLVLNFENGKISSYSCENFPTGQENRAFIRENLLFRHKTLPMGEFAVGTNTTAYVVAKKYGIQDKLPILIAEKTGPHFAVGDTCYANSEKVRLFNPDGKEIVAKDNEVSRLRDKAPDKAYFDCHTDITIPYDELGELTAVGRDGSRTAIIREGRFVLPGTEELNRPFEE